MNDINDIHVAFINGQYKDMVAYINEFGVYEFIEELDADEGITDSVKYAMVRKYAIVNDIVNN